MSSTPHNKPPASKGAALVTGSAQGIGRTIALQLADDGYDVALNDIPSKAAAIESVLAEITARGRRGIAAPGDVSVEADVIGMIAHTVAELGALNVMIANAGILLLGPLSETSTDDWDRIFSVNVRGTFLCYKHAATQMITQGRGGRIIGASSVLGKKGAAKVVGYCATKFAVRGLTQSAALEYGQHGITVNAYAPGAIETTMLETLGSAHAIPGVSGIDSFKAGAATGTNGLPEDVAGLVSYLVSPEARFVTGQSININGGREFD